MIGELLRTDARRRPARSSGRADRRAVRLEVARPLDRAATSARLAVEGVSLHGARWRDPRRRGRRGLRTGRADRVPSRACAPVRGGTVRVDGAVVTGLSVARIRQAPVSPMCRRTAVAPASSATLSVAESAVLAERRRTALVAGSASCARGAIRRARRATLIEALRHPSRLTPTSLAGRCPAAISRRSSSPARCPRRPWRRRRLLPHPRARLRVDRGRRAVSSSPRVIAAPRSSRSRPTSTSCSRSPTGSSSWTHGRITGELSAGRRDGRAARPPDGRRAA